MKSNRVVILGGGFGGVACAREFSNKYPQFQVTLIDRSPYHVIHSNLYELASAPEELADLSKLKHTVAIPLQSIFKDTRVRVKQGKVRGIDAEKKMVHLEHGAMPYDYLISSLGAGPNFYGISGAQEYAIPLQSVGDALRIRNQVEFAVQTRRYATQSDVIRLMIAGGGIAGAEVAAELQGMLDFVAWKNGFDRAKIEIVIVEGTVQLLPGFNAKISRAVTQRLKLLGVTILTNLMISNVEDGMVTFSNGEKSAFDCLVWTAGVKALPLPLPQPPLTSRGDRVEVDACFRVMGRQNIFTIGDQGCHHMPNGNPLPGTASQAIDQGRYIAQAIAALDKNVKPRKHECREYPFLIPLGGKWAIFSGKRLYIKGYFGYLIRQMVWLHYYISMLGVADGLRLYNRSSAEFSKND